MPPLRCCPCLIHYQGIYPDTPLWLEPCDDAMWQTGDDRQARGSRSPGWYGVGDYIESIDFCCEGEPAEYCGTAANLPADGGKRWANVSGCVGSPGSTYAEFVSDRDHLDSDWLKATNFSFDLPTDEDAIVVIKSVTARVTCQDGGGTGITDLSIKLVVDGELAGSDQAAGTAWPANKATIAYGSGTWGVEGGLTVAKVNAEGFGVAIRVHANQAEGIARVFAIELSVVYSLSWRNRYFPAVGCDEPGEMRWLRKPNPSGTGMGYLIVTGQFYGSADLIVVASYDPDDDTIASPAMRIASRLLDDCYPFPGYETDPVYIIEVGYYSNGTFSKTDEWTYANPDHPLVLTKVADEWFEFAFALGPGVEHFFAASGESKWYAHDATNDGPYIGIKGGKVIIESVTWSMHRDYRADCAHPETCWDNWRDTLPPEKLHMTFEVLGPCACSNYPIEAVLKQGASGSYGVDDPCPYISGAFREIDPPVPCPVGFDRVDIYGKLQFTLACNTTNFSGTYAWDGEPDFGYWSKKMYSISAQGDPVHIVFEGTLIIPCTDAPPNCNKLSCPCRITITE